MEDFNINFYADHSRFLLCLFTNYESMPNMGPCQESFGKLSKEALLRDFASRAFYAAFLKVRKELSDPKAQHAAVLSQLGGKYQNMFREMREYRVSADYHVDTPFTSPIQVKGYSQCYPQRLIATMDILMNATGEQLSSNHVTLEENRKRNS